MKGKGNIQTENAQTEASTDRKMPTILMEPWPVPGLEPPPPDTADLSAKQTETCGVNKLWANRPNSRFFNIIICCLASR